MVISFYIKNISLIHKIEYICNDLHKIFERIFHFFTTTCGYNWDKDIKNQFLEWIDKYNKFINIYLTNSEILSNLYDKFNADNIIYTLNSFQSYMVESIENIERGGDKGVK